MIEEIINILVRSNEIEPDEKEVYQYGLELLAKKILHVAMILLIGAVCNRFLGVLSFLIAYVSIREYAGGYHAKTEVGCCLCTGIVTLCTIVLLNMLQYLAAIYYYIVFIICGIIIWFLSPRETLNRPLEKQEKYIYKKMTHKYLLLEGGICLAFSLNRTLSYGIICAWIMETAMLLLDLPKEEEHMDND